MYSLSGFSLPFRFYFYFSFILFLNVFVFNTHPFSLFYPLLFFFFLYISFFSSYSFPYEFSSSRHYVSDIKSVLFSPSQVHLFLFCVAGDFPLFIFIQIVTRPVYFLQSTFHISNQSLWRYHFLSLSFPLLMSLLYSFSLAVLILLSFLLFLSLSHYHWLSLSPFPAPSSCFLCVFLGA